MPRSRPRRRVNMAVGRCASPIYHVPCRSPEPRARQIQTIFAEFPPDWVRRIHPDRPRRSLGTCMPGLVAFASEQVDHFPIESRDVVGLAARHKALIDDDLLIHPLRSCISKVGPQGRPRRQAPPASGSRFDNRPGPVADRGDRLPASKNAPTKATASGSVRRLSGLMTPPGNGSALNASGRALSRSTSTGKVSPQSVKS